MPEGVIGGERERKTAGTSSYIVVTLSSFSIQAQKLCGETIITHLGDFGPAGLLDYRARLKSPRHVEGRLFVTPHTGVQLVNVAYTQREGALR